MIFFVRLCIAVNYDVGTDVTKNLGLCFKNVHRLNLKLIIKVLPQTSVKTVVNMSLADSMPLTAAGKVDYLALEKMVEESHT